MDSCNTDEDPRSENHIVTRHLCNLFELASSEDICQSSHPCFFVHIIRTIKEIFAEEKLVSEGSNKLSGELVEWTILRCKHILLYTRAQDAFAFEIGEHSVAHMS